jgi:ABC-2 type transport system ATP-binding protein
LSRGMRQKLAICCAWLSEPRVALLDEPLSGLDPRGIRAARDAIRVLAQSGCCVVLSSHLLELVGALADRILIMDHGKGVFCGTPEEARSKLALAEGGSLEEVFLAATSTNGSTSEAFEQASNDAAAEMGEVPPATLRPEPSEPTETR